MPLRDQCGISQHTGTAILSDKAKPVPEKNWILSKSPFLANGVLSSALLFFFLALLYTLFLSNLEELRWKLLYSAVFLGGLVLYGISLACPREWKVNFALLNISLFLSVYMSEVIVRGSKGHSL